MKHCLWAVALFAGMSAALHAGDVKLALGDKGLEIDAGSAGKFLLAVPVLNSGDQAEKPVFEATGKDKGVAKYAGGARLEIEIAGDEVAYRFSDVPDAGRSWQASMQIPGGFVNGGKYALAGKPLVDFPKEVGTQQHLDKGDAGGKLALVAPSGDGFVLDPPTNWYGLQDNRVHNWGNAFVYSFLYDIKAYPGKNEFRVKVSAYKP